MSLSFAIQGRPPSKPGEGPSANHRVVEPRLFRGAWHPAAARPHLHRSRLGEGADGRGDRRGVRHAVTSRMKIRSAAASTSATARTASTRSSASSATCTTTASTPIRSPTMYVPYRQDIFSGMWLVAQNRRRSGAVDVDRRAQAVREIDPALPAFSISPLENVISESVAQRRFSMLLLGLFALIAAVPRGRRTLRRRGLHRQPAHAGDRRAHGDRRADRSDVLRMVVGGGMKLALVGVVIGIAGALAVARLVAADALRGHAVRSRELSR